MQQREHLGGAGQNHQLTNVDRFGSRHLPEAPEVPAKNLPLLLEHPLNVHLLREQAGLDLNGNVGQRMVQDSRKASRRIRRQHQGPAAALSRQRCRCRGDRGRPDAPLTGKEHASHALSALEVLFEIFQRGVDHAILDLAPE